MEPVITPEKRAAYNENGFANLGVLIGLDEVEHLREDLEVFARTHPAGDYGRIHNNLWRTLPRFQRLVTSPDLINTVCALLNVPEVVLFQDNLVWKVPGSGCIEWHQDYSYQPLGAAKGVTIWLSLDDATPENGCLHYIPKTHLEPEHQPANFTADCEQPGLENLPVMDLTHRAHEIQSAPARPGEMLAHHPLTWHMSPANTTTRPRRAYSINWITPDVVWDPVHAAHPFNYYVRLNDGEPLNGEMFPHFSPSEKKCPDT